MQKENVLSPFSKGINDYYNGWEITTYSTITNNNNKIIVSYNNGTNSTQHLIRLTNGSYSGDGLATHLQTELNQIDSDIFTVTLNDTNKVTITSDSPSTFSLQWKKTYDNYLINTHNTFGFEKEDYSFSNTITSPNEINLYLNENGESSIIKKYNGETNAITINGLKSNGANPGIGTKTSKHTKYILVPPEHINGSLNIRGENNILLDKDYSFGNDDFYNGWNIITYTNGLYQCSHITDYHNDTQKITAPSLDINNLSSGNTSYSIVNQKHLTGYLRKNIPSVFPPGDKNGILSVTPMKTHTNNDSPINDIDPEGLIIRLYGCLLYTSPSPRDS